MQNKNRKFNRSECRKNFGAKLTVSSLTLTFIRVACANIWTVLHTAHTHMQAHTHLIHSHALTVEPTQSLWCVAELTRTWTWIRGTLLCVASGQQRQVANGKWQLPGGKHGTSGKSLRSARTFPFASRNESESAAPIPEASLPRFVPQQLLRFQLPLGCRRRQRRSFAAAARVAPRWGLLSLITTRVAVVAFFCLVVCCCCCWKCCSWLSETSDKARRKVKVFL